MGLDFSVATPVFNEAAVLDELVDRIDTACRTTGLNYEIVIVDDHSSDATPAILAAACARVSTLRVERLPINRGQWGATAFGLSSARGAIVVTLDGDLQDPPEIIPQLIDRLVGDASVDSVFACKTRRDDPWWFLVGIGVFRAVQDRFSPATLPAGAGAYVAMRRPIAQRAAKVGFAMVNLAPVLAALGTSCTSVAYEKRGRYDGKSRVGPWNLLREAVSSWAITGALEALVGALGRGALLVSLALWLFAACTEGRTAPGFTALAVVAAGVWPVAMVVAASVRKRRIDGLAAAL